MIGKPKSIVQLMTSHPTGAEFRERVAGSPPAHMPAGLKAADG